MSETVAKKYPKQCSGAVTVLQYIVSNILRFFDAVKGFGSALIFEGGMSEQ